MPIHITLDHDLRLMNTVCSGTLTLDEIKHYQYTAWMEPSIYGYNELFDFNDSDLSNISFSDLITVAQAASKFYMLDTESRFAFLTHNSNHIEMADFYIAAKDVSEGPSRDIKRFDSSKTAMAWLLEDYR